MCHRVAVPSIYFAAYAADIEDCYEIFDAHYCEPNQFLYDSYNDSGAFYVDSGTASAGKIF
jgi:hypothetical protein